MEISLSRLSEAEKKVPAFFAFIAATVAACFTGMFYKGLQLVATYPDNRMLSTLRYTHRLLDEGRGILIFPENSSDGYKAVLEEFLRASCCLQRPISSTGAWICPFTPFIGTKSQHDGHRQARVLQRLA